MVRPSSSTKARTWSSRPRRFLSARVATSEDAFKATASGALFLPEGTAFKDLKVGVNLGGANVSFTLDHKGQGLTGCCSLVMRPNTKSPVDKTNNNTTFTLRLRGGDWASDWGDDGLVDDNLKNVNIVIPVLITIKGNVFATTAEAKYTSQRGKGGHAKSVRARR